MGRPRELNPESVLELLAKERTQSKQVSGPDLAPSIIARILIECIRPIMDSFKRRLSSLCPPHGRKGFSAGIIGGIGSDCIGGTEAVAAAYKSTI